jgi:hypothetical protein
VAQFFGQTGAVRIDLPRHVEEEARCRGYRFKLSVDALAFPIRRKIISQGAIAVIKAENQPPGM